MKKTFWGIVLLTLTSLSCLNGQTIQQKQAGTAIISQLLGNQFKVDANATRILSQKEASDVLMAQPDIPQPTRATISATLDIDRTNPNWRGVLTAVSTDCGEIPVIITENSDGRSPIVIVVLPPDNKCTRLVGALAPYVYSEEVSSSGNTQHCTSQLCVKVAQRDYREFFDCLEVITIVRGESVCIAVSDCNAEQPCTSGSGVSFNGVNVRDVLFMSK